MSLRFLQHIFQYHGAVKAKIAHHHGSKKAHHQGPKPHHTHTTGSHPSAPPHIKPTPDAKWNGQAGWKP